MSARFDNVEFCGVLVHNQSRSVHSSFVPVLWSAWHSHRRVASIASVTSIILAIDGWILSGTQFAIASGLNVDVVVVFSRERFVGVAHMILCSSTVLLAFL